MKFLRVSESLIINTDHIISAEYAPKRTVVAHTDDFGEDVPEHTVNSTLEIITTELCPKPIYEYDGNAVGGTSVSRHVIVRGIDADVAWANLTE